MKASLTLLILLLPAAMLSGCSSGQPPNNSAASARPAESSAGSSQNSNQTGHSEGAAPIQPASKNSGESTKAKSDTPAQLIGEYEAREIEGGGVVTMVSSIQTRFYFLADGNYSRTSKKGGRVYHSDSGQFRIDPPDKLVLTILVSGKGSQQTIQKPPLVKTHKFALSADGDELRLTSDKGSTAVFRRVSKPKTG